MSGYTCLHHTIQKFRKVSLGKNIDLINAWIKKTWPAFWLAKNVASWDQSLDRLSQEKSNAQLWFGIRHEIKLILTLPDSKVPFFFFFPFFKESSSFVPRRCATRACAWLINVDWRVNLKVPYAESIGLVMHSQTGWPNPDGTAKMYIKLTFYRYNVAFMWILLIFVNG